MSLGRTAHPVLRLVDGVERRPRHVWPPVNTPRQAAVARENRSAAGLPAEDARRVFAARVADALQGGPAAVLPADRRRRLVTRAADLGLRPFDANLIIAIVQDAARSGARPGPADPRLAFVSGACAGRGARTILLSLAAAATLGLLLAGALAFWILRG